MKSRIIVSSVLLVVCSTSHAGFSFRSFFSFGRDRAKAEAPRETETKAAEKAEVEKAIVAKEALGISFPERTAEEQRVAEAILNNRFNISTNGGKVVLGEMEITGVKRNQVALLASEGSTSLIVDFAASKNQTIESQLTSLAQELGTPGMRSTDDGPVVFSLDKADPAKVKAVLEKIAITPKEKELEVAGPVPQWRIRGAIKKTGAQTHKFIKDLPIATLKITEETIPVIMTEFVNKAGPSGKPLLGREDGTKYTEAQLRERYLGSVVSLQFKKDGSADFYPIGKVVLAEKYEARQMGEVFAKNPKAEAPLNAFLETLGSNRQVVEHNLIGNLKVTPVEMYKLSEIGLPVERALKMDSPWDAQVKAADKEAYITMDPGYNQYYMIQTEGAYPIGYVPAQ